MPDSSRLSQNYAHAKSPARVAALDELPAHNAPAGKPVPLAAAIVGLANSARLPDAIQPACALPRASSPRMMNPTDVPLTDVERFASQLPPSLA